MNTRLGYPSRYLKSVALLSALIVAALTGVPDHSHAQTSHEYPAAEPNVTYNDVLELGYAEPLAKLAYASEMPDIQYGLMWLPGPTAANSPAPLVIFIHGGCWLNSFDVQYANGFATALAQAGYAVWSLEYRRTGDTGGGWPGTFEDIRQGIEARHLLADYPVDTENFVIAGHSAGGHLALLAGTVVEQARAIVGLAGIANLVDYARGSNSCQTITDDFMGTTPELDPQRYTLADPAQQKLHNNSYLLEGSADAIVPLYASPVNGARHVVVQDAGHFDWVYPGTPAFTRFLTLLGGIFSQ